MHPTSLQRTENALAAIAAAGEEGRRIFTRVYAEAALAAARAADARAASGTPLGPLDGCVVSVKDLFDVAGEPTTAGSAVLRSAAPATQDAAIVQRLRAAGAVIVGKTNMTEFAFSGVGINPHFGTPGNALDATRIPGGSSAGAGVAVARGFSDISIGSDTGGSVRIPAALNGITGFKPTQQRVPRDGAFPLSFTLDAVGPLARSVLECAQADAVMAGQPWQPLPRRQLRGLRVGVPRGLLFTQTEDAVAQAFEQVLQALAQAGARVDDVALDDWLGAPARLQQNGSITAAEAAHIHADVLAHQPDAIDSAVLARLRPGQSIELLKELHILTREGRLNQDLRRKLKQVYHLYQFIEPLLQELAQDGHTPTLADHGAGKSYLGFILYDLFFKALGRGEIYGIEWRAELVQRSRALAVQLGCAHALSGHGRGRRGATGRPARAL